MTETEANYFASRWPDAAEFLNRCTLRQEVRVLRGRRRLNIWERDRLAELVELDAKTGFMSRL